MALPRIFITGITGMVGSHLADYLLEKTDWELYGLCRWRSPMDNLSHLVGRINDKDRLTLLYGDLRDTLSIREAVAKSRPNYVFHLAAQSFPRTSFDAPIDTMTTRMFTHTGPRRGNVFAESTFAKQIAMIEKNFIPPVVKIGNLQSLRTIADVRDAVRAYYMLVTVKPTTGAYYNIGGEHSCTVGTS